MSIKVVVGRDKNWHIWEIDGEENGRLIKKLACECYLGLANSSNG